MMSDSQKPRVVPVLVPMPAERGYSYIVPEGAEVVPGSIVQVPLGPRQVFGVVWDGETDAVDPKKLKKITEVFDCPPLQGDMRRFIEWVSDYTISPPGLVARMALRAPAGFEAEPLMQALRITGVKPDRMTAARTRVLELANDGMAWSRSGLSHAAGVSSTVVDGLHAQGVFEVVELPRGPVVPLPDTHYAKTELSAGPAGSQRCADDKASRQARFPSRFSTA